MGSLARRSGQPPRRAVRGARGRAGRRAGRVVSGGVARCAREAGAGRAALRARWPATFADGAYVPLRVRGPLGRHAVAFARCSDEATVVVVATRLAGRLLGEAPELPRVGRAMGRYGGRAAARYRRAVDGRAGGAGCGRRGGTHFAARPLPGVLACRGARRRASARHASVTSAARVVALHALHDRQPVGRQRGPALAGRVVVLHHDQVLFDQREDILAVDLELLRCAMHRAAWRIMCGQHARSPLAAARDARRRAAMQGPCRVAWRRRYPGRLRAARCGTTRRPVRGAKFSTACNAGGKPAHDAPGTPAGSGSP